MPARDKTPKKFPKKRTKKAEKPNAIVEDGHSSSRRVVHLSFSFLMLIAGIFTPPLVSRYSPRLEKYVSKIQPGNRIGSYSDEDVYKVEQPLIYGDDESNSQIKFIECDEEHLPHFLHEEGDSAGAHIFCFSNNSFKVFANYHELSKPMPLKGWEDLKATIDVDIGVKSHVESHTQPWAFYSITGERLVGELDDNSGSMEILKQHGMVILFEGGSWIWPGVRIGFKRRVEVSTGYPTNSKKILEIETLSLKPLVLSVKNFIAINECDHIQEVSSPDMEYSEVSLMDKDKGRPASDFRTSQSSFLEANDEITLAIEKRTASLTRVPRNHQEFTQVLRYGFTEKYSAHLDYFDPKFYQQDTSTLRLIEHGKRNRLTTVFWYLSDVEEGGHTVFPRFNGAPQPWNFDDCTKGLLVKPEKGKVIVFYSLLPNGKGDELSLHGACPVKDGVKWAANKWVWNAPMNYVS